MRLRPLAPCLALLMTTVVITACGQKGPLYLPSAQPERQPAPAATEPAQSAAPSSQPVED